VLDTPIGLFAAADTRGETSGKDAYGELLVPVLKDLPAVEDLSLELGARFSDYNTAGGSWTYKGLANWKVNRFIGVRGGYQVANRAPNIAELYLGVTQTVASFPESDPCAVTTLAKYGNVASNPNRAKVQALCSAIIGTGTSQFDAAPNTWPGGNGGYFPLEREARSGSADLKPEEAKTWTFGTVLRSPFESPALSRMSASLDYYRIEINDTIAPLSAGAVYALCFNADGASNPNYLKNDPGGYCGLTSRDGVTGGRLQVEAPYANLGVTKTSGLDVQWNWNTDLADIGMQSVPGAISVSIAANVLFDFTTQTNPLAPPVQNKGTLSNATGSTAQTGQYDYRTFTTISYALGGVNVGTTWQHLPSIENAAYAMDHTTPIQGAGSYDLLSLFGSWDYTEHLSLRAGIDNLFDRQPEIVGYTPGVTNSKGTTASGFYDLLGRRFYAGAKLKF
jgi:outer membrane receptor protein involved in Fe transport